MRARPRAHQCPNFMAFKGIDQGLRVPQVKHKDRKVIFHAQRYGRAVHHLKSAI